MGKRNACGGGGGGDEENSSPLFPQPSIFPHPVHVSTDPTNLSFAAHSFAQVMQGQQDRHLQADMGAERDLLATCFFTTARMQCLSLSAVFCPYFLQPLMYLMLFQTVHLGFIRCDKTYRLFAAMTIKRKYPTHCFTTAGEYCSAGT